jgi:apolipoprotein N-acyltransferase
MTPKLTYTLAAASGLLLALAFPPFGFSLAAWFALVPLLFAATALSGKSFLQGLLAGVVFRAISMHWITQLLHDYTGASWGVSVGAVGLLVLYLSLYTGLFVWALRLITRHFGPYGILMAPLLWVALAYANAHMITGFHWNTLASSQSHHLRLVQMVEFTGSEGLSFWVVLVNVALFLLLRMGAGPRERRVPVRYALLTAALTAILLVGLWAWGAWRIAWFESRTSEGNPLRVRIVNPSIAQNVKWMPAFQKKALDRLAALSRKGDSRPDLIIWPEAAVPFILDQNPFVSGLLYDLAESLGAPILFGAPGYRSDDRGAAFTNSALLILPDRTVGGTYEKQRLVPFGEYVPLRPLLPFVPAVARGLAAGDLRAGQSAAPITLGEHRLGVLICYEVIFGDLVRETLEAGSNVLVNLSNDAWLARAGVLQHFAMGRLRAVEARVPMIRVANRGISGVIDPTGKLGCRIAPEEAASRDCLVKIKTVVPPRRFTAEAFPIACVLFSGLLVWIAWVRQQKALRSPGPRAKDPGTPPGGEAG